jgi:AcrR family transcriptional regulator
MPTSKRSDQKAEARKAILDAAVAVTIERRGRQVTTSLVAERASCAKGLVHYHFSTKERLLAEVAARLWSERAASWRAALGAGDAKRALEAAWNLLQAETTDGRASAIAQLGLMDGKLITQSVNTGRAAFTDVLATTVPKLLARMELEASVPAPELAALLAATAEGLSMRLAGGTSAADLEPAWAAFWVGLLALTRPTRR